MSAVKGLKTGVPEAGTVMGIDASTTSVAFAVIRDGRLDTTGKLNLTGDLYDKIAQAAEYIGAMLDVMKPDFVCIESAVFVSNKSVVVKLAYVYGAILAESHRRGIPVADVSPTTWMSFIGNGPTTKQEKADIKRDLDGKPTASRIKGEARKRRKQKTMDWASQRFGAHIEDHDVGDAVGVAWYAHENYTKRPS